jgi:hypothetical protein
MFEIKTVDFNEIYNSAITINFYDQPFSIK